MGNLIERMVASSCAARLAMVAVLATTALAFDVRFDGHAVLSCEMRDAAMAHEIHTAAKTQDLDIWSHSVKVGKSLHIQVPEHRRHFWENKYGCSPMIEDVQEVIDQQFSHAGLETLVGESEGEADWFTQYHRFGEIVRRSKELADTHKDLVRFVPSIGKSHEGRDIPVMHITAPS